ncbi:MAG: alkaline phosphatase [Bacillota bacterium]
MKTSKTFVRALSALICLGLLMSLLPAAALAQARPITITFDGRTVASEAPLVIINHTLMVPLRIVFETLDAYVEWDGATSTITGRKAGTIIRLRVGDRTATVNDRTVSLPEAARIEGGRTLVPLRFISEALGVRVEWDSASRTAHIFSTEGARNVIFIHPDGASPSFFAAARMLHYGPDGELNWDRLPSTAVYNGHMKDNLTGTSNAGAVTHAYGVKVHDRSYGLDESGNPVVSRSGQRLTILEEAKAAGFSVGMVNTGTITEPGTGVWGARVADRNDHAGIAKELIMRPDGQVIDVIFGGGEVWFLPNTIVGRHGKPGRRTDGLNLITEAIARGYRVIYTKDELLNLPPETTRVLGLFAAHDTYNDNNDEATPRYTYTEEQLRAEGLMDYDPNAPTFAQMVDAAIKILSKNQNRGFYLVAEEEGTDNLANFALNARGTIEATKRADDAIGVALEFARRNPNTLVITAADSEASGLSVVGNPPLSTGNVVPTQELRRRDGTIYFTEYLDGRDGTNTPPFMSAPDRNGNSWPFAIAWSTRADHSGSIVARAFGLHADMLRGTVDNTEIYRIKYRVLFDKVLP